MREIHSFSNTLKMWYLIHKRDLPWRKSKDPYLIWLSEIIMQQTRIAQGTSYFEKFSEEYKDVFALARADEKQVLNHWQGLGYYSRARNLLSTARSVVEHHGGKFPAFMNRNLSQMEMSFVCFQGFLDCLHQLMIRKGPKSSKNLPSNCSTRKIPEPTTRPLWNLVHWSVSLKIPIATTVF